MKALTYWGPGDVRHQDVAAPVLIDERSAIVDVTLASICGSDLHVYAGAAFNEDIGFCLGHEAVGVVREVGSAVTGFRPGDRVMIPGSVGCSLCQPCREGLVSLCLTRSRDNPVSAYGLSSHLQGSQADQVCVPHAEVNLAELPDDVSDETGVVLIDAAATAMYAWRRARVVPGEPVAVVGLGPIGILAGILTLALGAAEVYGVDSAPQRLAHAESVGISPVHAEEAKAVIRQRTAGRGVQAVIEAVGRDSSIQLALGLARVQGHVSIVGITQSKAFPLHLQLAQVKELEIAIGLCSVQRELPELLALTRSGRFLPASVINHRRPLSEGSEVYAELAGRRTGILKAVLETGQ